VTQILISVEKGRSNN